MRSQQLRLAVVAAPLFAASAVWLGVRADHLTYPLASGVYKGYLGASTTLIGALWLVRRPASRLGYLLIGLGVASWMTAFQAAEWAPLYAAGTFADAPALTLTFWACLAYPSGRLETRLDRALVGLTVGRFALLYIPHLLFTPSVQGGGPLSQCLPGCPDNAWFITATPGLSEFLENVRTFLGLLLAVAILVVFLRRFSTASAPRRRARAAVAATSLLFLPVFITFHTARAVIEVAPARLEDIGWVLVAARIVFPLGFLLALLQADVFAARARRHLLAALAHVRGPAEWRNAVAEALDDPSLRIAYWEPATGRYVDPGGSVLIPYHDADRVWLPIDRDGAPVALISADASIAEDPELATAAADATLIAFGRGELDRRLRASLESGEAERLRLQRDLHDSVQQRLTALRIHLGIAGELAVQDADVNALMRQLGEEVDEAVTELRTVAHGLYPRTLRRHGVAAALHERLDAGGDRVHIEADGFGRHDGAVENAIFFSCLEAIQNARKHAGPRATVTVRLEALDGSVRFEVADDGVGFDQSVVTTGVGLFNIADRMTAVGGSCSVDTGRGRGTRVRGYAPTGRPPGRFHVTSSGEGTDERRARTMA